MSAPKKISDWNEAASRLRDYAHLLVSAYPEIRALETPETLQMTRERIIINMLQFAWCDAIRTEFFDAIKSQPILASRLPIAEKLMRADHFEGNPICGHPGMKPQIATFDGKEAICFDASMTMLQPLPLLAFYLNKVCAVMDAADEAGQPPHEYETPPNAKGS